MYIICISIYQCSNKIFLNQALFHLGEGTSAMTNPFAVANKICLKQAIS
jgi:hypothetical protein